MAKPFTYTRSGPAPRSEKTGSLKGKKVLVGVSSSGQLSRLTALFLQSQGAEVGLLHLKLSPLFQSLRRRKLDREMLPEDIEAWAKDHQMDFRVLDRVHESEKFAEGYLNHHLNQMWVPDLRTKLDSLFLFPVLMDLAMKEGALLATGHRARVSELTSGAKAGEVQLLRSKDQGIDQSNQLALIPRKFLKYLQLPMGQIQKDELWKLLNEKKLLLSASEDEVFEELSDLPTFASLEKFFHVKKLKRVSRRGNIYNTAEKALGIHQGLYLHEVGTMMAIEGDQEKRCVLGHEILKSRVVVGKQSQLDRAGCVTGAVTWLVDEPDLRAPQVEFEMVLEGEHQKPLRVGAELLPDSALRLSLIRDDDSSAEPFRPRLGAGIALYRGSQCVGRTQVVATFR